MMPIAFHEDAREEYREAIRYYFEIDPDLQAGFRSEVLQQLRMISDNPELFSVRRYGVRRANLERFGLYYIAYTLWKGQVVIMAIGHARKRPYYWRRRPKHYRDTH
jgi:plasmid stabilization system protein ParE